MLDGREGSRFVDRLLPSRPWLITLFLLLALASTAAKVFLAGQGHNIDVESWNLLADLVLEGKNVYAETGRNNWGPVWCHMAAAARFAEVHLLGTDTLEDFHRILALVLSVADVAIAFLLARYHSFVAGALFLVNPVSLLLTGFHTQFENLAILLGLASCLMLDRYERAQPVKLGLAMVVLGVSLATKHVLVFLPLWFLLRPHASRLRRLVCLVPYGIFAASFLPFVRDERGLEGVIEHVLTYESTHLDGFFPNLVQTAIPLKAVEMLFSWVPLFSGFRFIWLAAMLLTGFAVREKTHREQLFVYLVAMVVFSSAIADQYLVIPVATCVVYWRELWAWWYLMMTGVYLTASPVNIGMLPAVAPYAETVQQLGLERWQSIAALLVFLVLYLARHRRGTGA